MKIYIAGPMSGLPEQNYPAFHATAATLRAEGFEVVSPAEVCSELGGDWADYMRRDIPALLTCDTIYLLKGWAKSKGARLEHTIALSLAMTVIYEEPAQ